MTEELTPENRKEAFLAKAAGESVETPTPESREEYFLNKIAEGGGGGTSDFDSLTNRPKYDNATMTKDTNIPKVINTAFTGTDGTSAGVAGLVPAPATTDASKFLKADGTWDTAGGATVVQTTGTSTTDVMSQNAVTSALFADPTTEQLVQIGLNADAGTRNGSQSGRVAIGMGATASGYDLNIAIGGFAKAITPDNGGRAISIGATVQKNNTINIGGTYKSQDGTDNVIIGFGATANGGSHDYCVALGKDARCSRRAEVNIGTGTSATKGYNNTAYRVLGGVYDGQDAQDAVTVNQVNQTIDAINTALSTSIPHIGATS